MGFLIRKCDRCVHYHGRGSNRCLEPGCRCASEPDRPRTLRWLIAGLLINSASILGLAVAYILHLAA